MEGATWLLDPEAAPAMLAALWGAGAGLCLVGRRGRLAATLFTILAFGLHGQSDITLYFHHKRLCNRSCAAV